MGSGGFKEGPSEGKSGCKVRLKKMEGKEEIYV
jgi:hypothetical protein